MKALLHLHHGSSRLTTHCARFAFLAALALIPFTALAQAQTPPPSLEKATFDYYPKVVRSDSEAVISIESQTAGASFDANARYGAALISREQPKPADKPNPTVQVVNGILRVRCYFTGEQEHVINISAITASGEKRLTQCRVYSVEKDLYALRPYKGDFHMHSRYSDGKEAPAYVAGCCRRIGLDFMALTDHRQYAPSLEAIAAFKDLPVDLRIYPGEEVHCPSNRIHIINFGGSFSINDLYKKDEAAYRAQVQAIAKHVKAKLSDADRFQYASCVWAFNKIREAGGMGIFCHPYWIYQDNYNAPEALIKTLFENRPFDAYELIGGYFRNEAASNMLQAARYHEECARGRQVPIVGVSDAHGCETGALFGWYYSVVLARSTNLPDLIHGFKSLQSVAIEALPGESPRIHGPFRLVKYTEFLLREVFPRHDALCAEEGEQMLAYIAKKPGALANLKQYQGRTRALMDRYFN
ncbi:MAG TPA: hypothetical protein VHR86_04490 [Armatimonadota bacterium]|nr:hypothetical protein [Armatimonadota bacterium]